MCHTQDEDEQLAMAIAASMEDAPPSASDASTSAAAASPSRQAQGAGQANGRVGNGYERRQHKPAGKKRSMYHIHCRHAHIPIRVQNAV